MADLEDYSCAVAMWRRTRLVAAAAFIATHLRIAGAEVLRHASRSQNRPQFHPCEALVEPWIGAQAVPLRRNSEMDQPRITYVESALEKLEGLVEGRLVGEQGVPGVRRSALR